MGIKKGPDRCVLCLRSEDEAIREQVKKGTGCGNPKCVFAESIKRAIEEYKKAKESRYCIECGCEFLEGDIFCFNCGCKRSL